MYISAYFNTIFTQGKPAIQAKLTELLKTNSDYQVIFTGHSLGGAMATIFAVDSVLSGYVPKTASSPLLIAYASPRVGNIHFANKVNLNVPHIFRIVRDGDPVTSVPPCAYFGKCQNKLNVDFFPGGELTTAQKNIVDNSYWHVPGLILYDSDMVNFNNCGRSYSENNTDLTCHIALSMSVSKHTNYFNQSVGEFCSGARKFLKKLNLLRKKKKLRRMKRNQRKIKKFFF